MKHKNEIDWKVKSTHHWIRGEPMTWTGTRWVVGHVGEDGADVEENDQPHVKQIKIKENNKMLKSIEELLVEAEAEIKERGLTLTFEEFNESADKGTFVERKLEAAQALLESNPRRVKKNNGRADNSPMREALKSDPNKARLVESFKALGLSQKEAEYAAMSEQEVAEAEFDLINPGVRKEIYGQ